jgi:hypothetical protein
MTMRTIGDSPYVAEFTASSFPLPPPEERREGDDFQGYLGSHTEDPEPQLIAPGSIVELGLSPVVPYRHCLDHVCRQPGSTASLRRLFPRLV